MERQKLYCPPTGNTPQVPPDYWRFQNGLIRRDLQTLTDQELYSLGWEGPFYNPIPREVYDINNPSVDEEMKVKFEQDDNLSFDEKSQCWLGISGWDYDPRIQQVVWFSKERKFLIIPIEENPIYYSKPIPSRVSPPLPKPGDEVYKRKVVANTNINQSSVKWKEFKTELMKSAEFNSYVASVMIEMPILASSFPVAISSLESNNYDNFMIIWEILNNSTTPPPREIKEKLLLLSKVCDLPVDFINSIL